MRRNALLVHTNVCQVDRKSHAGSQYFVTFIDNHSRKLWASLMKMKDQVLSVFKELHTRVERESGRKLKAVQGVLLLEGNPTRIYRAEDTGTKRASQEDEPDHHGESPKHASTC